MNHARNCANRAIAAAKAIEKMVVPYRDTVEAERLAGQAERFAAEGKPKAARKSARRCESILASAIKREEEERERRRKEQEEEDK